MEEEGYIKFVCRWRKEEITIPGGIEQDLLRWREKLYNLRLIGVDKSGAGFGNLSIRGKNGFRFYITGSATGGITKLNREHLARVDRFDIAKNLVFCTGLLKASSETLTHGAVYEARSDINAVIHTHSEALWEFLQGKVPATPEQCLYGTPALADAVKKQVNRMESGKPGILLLGGHYPGLLTFGTSPDEAGTLLTDLFGKNIKVES